MNEPKPGTKEAIDTGCLCPVIDNHYGKGRPYSDGRIEYIMNGDCPLHGLKQYLDAQHK